MSSGWPIRLSACIVSVALSFCRKTPKLGDELTDSTFASDLYLVGFVIHADLGNVRHLLAAFQEEPHPLRREARNAMYRRRRGLFAAYQLRPARTVPALKAIAPNAAFRIVIPFANGLHQQDNVETLLLSQIHFQP